MLYKTVPSPTPYDVPFSHSIWPYSKQTTDGRQSVAIAWPY